ncbi:Singlehypothetical proteinstranded nucleic acid binding R3H [Bipolaris maydis]|nr:Singlehypothetical proteinstranded nucleic acid binding R3H [Bipolaris maydis]
MLSMQEADWDTCRSTLEGHSSNVSAVAFSPDGQLVASASTVASDCSFTSAHSCNILYANLRTGMERRRQD